MKITIKKTAERLLEANHIKIITHRSPDGDAVGSALALYYALRSLGKEAEVICSDVFPKTFSFLYDSTRSFETPLSQTDLLVSVDLADTKLLGETYRYLKNEIDLAIDHHVSNALYAKETLLQITSSTAELLYLLFLEMGVKVNQQIASCLYTGLSTDTGCFRFSNVTAETLRIAAALYDCGVEASDINEKLFASKTKLYIEAEAKLYQSIQYFADGKIAVSVLDYDFFGHLPEGGEAEIDGVSALTKEIDGVVIGIGLREREKDVFRVSIRTGGTADASKLAQNFGGGGHVRAAGCLIKGTEDEVRDMLVKAAEKALSI